MRSGVDLYEGIAMLCTTRKPQFYFYLVIYGFDSIRSNFVIRLDFSKYYFNVWLCCKFQFKYFSMLSTKPLYPLPSLVVSASNYFNYFIDWIIGQSKALYIFESFFAIECFMIFSICTKAMLFHSNLFTNPNKTGKMFSFYKNLANSPGKWFTIH